MKLEEIKSVLFGVAVGDALGVPVEFKPRSYMVDNPMTDMIGYGTYNMPPGTWSDDSSMTFCLAEALTEETFSLNSVGKNFQKWLHESYWTANGVTFDVGNTTAKSILRLNDVEDAELAGGRDYGDNGNGSLMRISPLIFYIYLKTPNIRFKLIKDVSSITHGHLISIISCYYYLEFLKQLILKSRNKFEIYHNLKKRVKMNLLFHLITPDQMRPFERLLSENIYDLPEDEIISDGYVISSLEASVWCLLNTDSYEEAVLKAVNLGSDTDTTAAITGAMAGLLYGYQDIPEKWINQIARKEDIDDLADRMYNNLTKK